jgi:hypothetical protein
MRVLTFISNGKARLQAYKGGNVETFTKDVFEVINAWQTIGTLAGVALILQLFVKALKFKPINVLFAKHKIKWIKPYIAMSLGGISGGIGAYVAGTEISNGVCAGILAGITSVGWNETINKAKLSKRKN